MLSQFLQLLFCVSFAKNASNYLWVPSLASFYFSKNWRHWWIGLLQKKLSKKEAAESQGGGGEREFLLSQEPIDVRIWQMRRESLLHHLTPPDSQIIPLTWLHVIQTRISCPSVCLLFCLFAPIVWIKTRKKNRCSKFDCILWKSEWRLSWKICSLFFCIFKDYFVCFNQRANV